MARRGLELLLMVLLGALVVFLSIRYGEKEYKVEEVEVHADSIHHQYAYGIIIDSLILYKDKIRKNEFLADILQDYGVDYAKIDHLARKSKSVFDVRRMRAGNTFIIISTRDSLREVRFFIYESSASDYIVYDLRDSISIYKGKKEIRRIIATDCGIIQSSLWSIMVDKGTDPNLANELSEIYAWTIDFFGILEGDRYKVVYEKLFVDGQYIGLGKVIAAMFKHYDREYYTYRFLQDSVWDFFDDDGGSMRRTFLKAPLRYKRISSRYSHSRYHPILKIRRPHHGIDYAAASGTPVHAIGDGVVTFAGWKGQGGRTVKIKHNGTYTTAYLHLSGYGEGVVKGANVKQGQVIGYVGRSGLATGPHLDFRFYRNGQPIDPLKVESPPAKPIDSTYRDTFILYRDSLRRILDTIGEIQI
ncbi:MAG: M23 family metallopeptidase [Bacteroidota bacterium]|nr:M23 family metallopeptidase [Bacteroidota bacterium]